MKILDQNVEYFAKYSLFNLKGQKSKAAKMKLVLHYLQCGFFYLLLVIFFERKVCVAFACSHGIVLLCQNGKFL